MPQVPRPRPTDVDASPRATPPQRGVPALPPPRQAWSQMRRRLHLAMADLRRVVLDRCDRHPERTRLALALDGAIGDLDKLLDAFDGPLIELLDAAETAPDREIREDVLQRLGTHMADGRARFAQDELVDLMDRNGFVDLGVQAQLDDALTALARRLGIDAGAPVPFSPRKT
ncbi:hypothetical protein [Mitsuaria sp. GD03876]|uniref:hypothetical protein n=1 Tax=Mitsuaria sp. GD03876 TaxID=2975399 RepID=UPI0024495435|nr:hypothetical protein [Mitsuaria sp. GD03876]MDH0866109.1 hypothetical protein [Mitsuaria sp. GD03876]